MTGAYHPATARNDRAVHIDHRGQRSGTPAPPGEPAVVTHHLPPVTRHSIDGLRTELTERIENVRQDLTERYDRLSMRMDQLGKDIVRRNEHEQLLRQYEHRITSVEKTVEEIKRRVAA